MSIQTNFPAIKPTLLLDFANTEQLDPRITFTRASTATYYGTQTAKAEENLLLQSQTLTAGVWSSTNATVTADTAVAPDGTTTADTVTDDTASQAHVHSQNTVTIAGLVYTLSFFLKASTNNFAIVTLSSTTAQNYISAIVDLSTGAITQTATGTSATFTSSSITSVGSGWYRVVVTGSCTAGFTRAEMGLALAATGNTIATSGRTIYTGTGTSVFVWGAQLEQRSAVTAYTPTTTQSITNYIPRLLTAASGVARFDHNPTTFESLGLEIEEQRTNLVTYSEQFDNAAWTKTRASITANTIVAPSGELTGDKIVENTDNNSHFIQGSNVSVTAGTTYTFTIYAKAAERAWLRLTGNTAGLLGAAFYNLQTGTLGTVASGTTAAISSVGNGWYRCTFTRTETVTGNLNFSIAIASADNSNFYQGDGYSGIYIWGAQLEAGAFATSYIPTVASQVTRAADAASMTGTNFSSWYNQQQGSLYVEATPRQTVTQYVAIIGDGTISTLGIGFFIDNNQLAARVRGSGGSSTIGGGLAITANTEFKTMLSYAAYNNSWAYNGANRATGNTNIKPENSATLQIGSAPTGGTNLTGTIKKLSFYPVKLTDAQMNALTS